MLHIIFVKKVLISPAKTSVAYCLLHSIAVKKQLFKCPICCRRVHLAANRKNQNNEYEKDTG